MENTFLEKLNSLETFYKRKLAKIENKLSESEKLQASTEMFYSKKLAEVKNSCDSIEEKRHLSQKMNDIILNKVEKRLNNIEERLIEAVHSNENKINELERNVYRTQEKNNSDFKLVEKQLSEIYQKQYDHVGRKTIAKAENTELKYDKVIPNSGEVNEENVSTQRTVGYAINESDTDVLNVKDRKSDDTVYPSLKRRLTPSGISRIAFTAYLSNTVTELGKQHPIPFDQVMLNEGHAYDTVLHAFICPVNGIYMFQSAAMSTHTDSIQTEIVKDGVALVVIYAAGATGSHGYDQGFNSAVIQCNQGERVWVRVHAHYGTDLYGGRYTTFSGYLLWEI
ncbi:rho-associated protein kinase 1-like [Mercenaria mercenaria]|uniref:rho-associated protein kinase 1-like n=1 Tax=Mercenaria mercenaria TaxID=6596 RepID=UPI00234E5D72|nr:rho-associated protein kinase 1-like [Mercenaria mercenaria]